jgi:hypothetical protein
MKTKISIAFLALFILEIFIFQSCTKDLAENPKEESKTLFQVSNRSVEDICPRVVKDLPGCPWSSGVTIYTPRLSRL